MLILKIKKISICIKNVIGWANYSVFYVKGNSYEKSDWVPSFIGRRGAYKIGKALISLLKIYKLKVMTSQSLVIAFKT